MYSQLRYQTTGRYTRKLDRRCLRPTLTAIVLLRARVPIKRHGIKIRYNVINSGKGAPIYTNVMYSRLLRAGRIYSRYASRKGGFRASTRARFPGISSSAARCLFLRFLSLSLSLSLSFSLFLSLIPYDTRNYWDHLQPRSLVMRPRCERFWFIACEHRSRLHRPEKKSNRMQTRAHDIVVHESRCLGASRLCYRAVLSRALAHAF